MPQSTAMFLIMRGAKASPIDGYTGVLAGDLRRVARMTAEDPKSILLRWAMPSTFLWTPVAVVIGAVVGFLADAVGLPTPVADSLGLAVAVVPAMVLFAVWGWTVVIVRRCGTDRLLRMSQTELTRALHRATLVGYVCAALFAVLAGGSIRG
jgi:hypothetical protein